MGGDLPAERRKVDLYAFVFVSFLFICLLSVILSTVTSYCMNTAELKFTDVQHTTFLLKCFIMLCSSDNNYPRRLYSRRCGIEPSVAFVCLFVCLFVRALNGKTS